MSYRRRQIRQLAESILIGEHSQQGICESVAWCLGVKPGQAEPLAKELLDASILSKQTQDLRERLITHLHSSEAITTLSPLRTVRWPLVSWQPEIPSAHNRIEQWKLPKLANLEALAHWCGIAPTDLPWFSQLYKQSHSNEKKLHHYHYQTRTKSDGSHRILETPKSKLKWIQKKLHSELLSKVPCHNAAHGFIAGRSTLSHSERHVGKQVVIAMDLENFFLSVHSGRIVKLFRTLGYGHSVAAALTGICLNRTPEPFLRPIDNVATRKLYRTPHLPQGAPSSPALANLCAFNLDCRLTGLANSLEFEYSRYADDLVFSSYEHYQKKTSTLLRMAEEIIRGESFRVNQRKTRVMTQARRQQITGIVVNEKLNINRKEMKQLQAMLTNCIRLRPDTQNREDHPNFKAHIEGKLAYFSSINPERCRKLWELYDQIEWGPQPEAAASQKD